MADHRLVADWLAGYLEVTSNLEAKESLHRWTGLVCISAAIRRRLFLRMQYGDIFPNLYVYIVAASAAARKTVAMRYGQRLLTTAFPDIRIFHDDMTPQGLIKHMYQRAQKDKDKRPQGDFILFADELADLFGYDRARAAKMVILLTGVFGCPAEYDHLTVRDSLERLYNLYPVMIAATDPKNLHVLPNEAVAGLTGRIIWVIEKEKRHVNSGWIEEDTREDLERQLLYESLVHDLQRIAAMSGEIKVDREAREIYDAWYKKLSATHTGDKNTDAFFHRCHTTALQIGQLLSVSAGESKIMTVPNMETAIEYIEAQLPEVRRVSAWSGSGDYEVLRTKYIAYLVSQGGRTLRAKLLNHMGVDIGVFERVTNTLVHDGTLEQSTAITIALSNGATA